MSINVTVSGNPVSINRGKMVTCDPNRAKKEFDKRRLMRLEQVRQQSKNIAEDIRNKVRREKEKQMSQIEQEGKEKLRNWQNRKLLELQTQYKEALRELGTGHKQVVELEKENEVLEEQKEYNKEVASHRSRVAAAQLQIEKNKANIKKSIPIQQKKIVRDIENTRAALVSNMKKKQAGISPPIKKKKKKKSTANINITIPDSDSESDEVDLLNLENISDEDKSSSSAGKDSSNSNQVQEGTSCECTYDSEHPRKPLEMNEGNIASKFTYQEPPGDFNSGPTTNTNITKNLHGRNNLSQNLNRNIKDEDQKVPLDTRISDRIKRRELMVSEPDYCDIVAQTNPTPFVESNTQIRDAIDSRYLKCTCPNAEKEEDIPSKPPVKLKDVDDQPSKDTLDEINKVQFYDHPNRFSHEKRVPAGSHVERITTDSLEVIPNVISETEWHEKMRQRDKEARIRGQRALEKERIQKDYEEMMKKLPLLQKKERICEINKDRPEYHMSEERLKERERQKQNQLDNAYSKLFSSYKPAIVTLPSKKHDKDVVKSVDDKPTQSLNVGKWDVDHEQKMFTAEEVQEIIRSFTERQKPQDRQAKLKELLKSLKLQKEQLLKEIKALPKDDSINQLINDLNSVSDSDEKIKSSTVEKSERKRRREENTDSAESSSSSYIKAERGAKVKDKQKARRHSESTKTPSPRKRPKVKYKTKVLILQNTSTQTTPKVQSSSPEQDKLMEHEEKKTTCSKLHVPCDCNKENEQQEELCQILIKLNDKEDPEVVVKTKEIESKIVEDTSRIKEKSPRSKQSASKSIGVGTEEMDARPTKIEKVSAKVAEASVSEGPKKVSVRRTVVESKTDKTATRKDKPPQIDSKDSKSKSWPPQVDSKDSKSKSWKEQLSKNSISTTSTSYLSPPDFKKTVESHALTSSSDVSKESFYNLRKKPQQGNLHEMSAATSAPQSHSSSGERIIEPTLLKYIKKLLGRSRESIENLTVSTSNVQTPSESVVEMDSNNPMAPIHNLIKYLNFKAEDIAQQLSYSPDPSQIHYNSSASPSQESLQQEYNVDLSSKSHTKDSKRDSNSVKSKDSVSQQYADITDSCSRRIATLAAMINQIREEKIQMLQKPPGAEGLDTAEKLKSGSTTSSEDLPAGYLDLPESRESSKHSSLNSLDDDELHRRLMEIDMSLAKKLRTFSPPRENRATKDDINNDKADASDDPNNTEKELEMRLQRLLYQNIEGPPVSSTATNTIHSNMQFVPFLSDIPKLPKLEAQPETDQNTFNHKRPPPSKGLTVAKRFNGNISLIPHELSTIIEADSQMSTKMSSSQVSPNASRTSQSVSPRKALLVKPKNVVDHTSHSSTSSKSAKDVPDMVTKVSVIRKQNIEVTEDDKPKEKDSKTSSPLNLSYDISSKSIVYDASGNKSTISSAKSLKMSSSSSDDMDSIEAMLKSIGMEWAIPTLHKTKEALALTSSSSSLDFSAKKKAKEKESSSSEVSLKEYLQKQVLAKVSSSTLRSDASAGSLLSEFSELSAIQINSSTEKVVRRTSTPVTSSKSTSKSKSFGKRVAFSGDSDISSVKDESQKHSNKHSFVSLSEWSGSKDSKDSKEN